MRKFPLRSVTNVWYDSGMVLYMLYAPLALCLGRGWSHAESPQRYLRAMCAGFLAYIPTAIVSASVDGAFLIQRAQLGAVILQIFLTDYATQLALLILLMLLITRTRLRHLIALDGNKILPFCCGYFFCESVYRVLLTAAAHDIYGLFFFPTLRMMIILAIVQGVARAGAGHIAGGIWNFSLIVCVALLASILLWYNFLLISIVVMILGMVYIYTALAHAAR